MSCPNTVNCHCCRYALLPYWYTLFYENELTGMPPMRPLWVEFPEDQQTFAEEQQFMVGE